MVSEGEYKPKKKWLRNRGLKRTMGGLGITWSQPAETDINAAVDSKGNLVEVQKKKKVRENALRETGASKASTWQLFVGKKDDDANRQFIRKEGGEASGRLLTDN